MKTQLKHATSFLRVPVFFCLLKDQTRKKKKIHHIAQESHQCYFSKNTIPSWS